jgi:hypothetical protein
MAFLLQVSCCPLSGIAGGCRITPNLENFGTKTLLFPMAEFLETGLLYRFVRHGKRIGMIKTESEFIASKDGEYGFFFKHSECYIKASRSETAR